MDIDIELIAIAIHSPHGSRFTNVRFFLILECWVSQIPFFRWVMVPDDPPPVFILDGAALLESRRRLHAGTTAGALSQSFTSLGILYLKRTCLKILGAFSKRDSFKPKRGIRES